MHIEKFFDQDTATFTYIVIDEQTKHCAIIDSVLNFDMHAGKIAKQSMNQLIEYISDHQLQLEWILETHAHADHISAAYYLREQLGGKVAIGANIKKVLSHWVPIFNAENHTTCDGSQFDHLFVDNELFKIGHLDVRVINTPGHTPACVSYLIEDVAFVGDSIFMPYMGTARCDFPGGSAENLYQSIQKLLALPEQTKLYVGHDYPPPGQQPNCVASVAEQKQNNVLMKQGASAADFVSKRNQKDSTLTVPRLLLPAMQINLRAGQLPPPEDNGQSYLKLPLQWND